MNRSPCSILGLVIDLFCCFWLRQSSFRLDHKQQSSKQNQKKWKHSDSSDSDLEIPSSLIRLCLLLQFLISQGCCYLSYDSDYNSVTRENQPYTCATASVWLAELPSKFPCFPKFQSITLKLCWITQFWRDLQSPLLTSENPKRVGWMMHLLHTKLMHTGIHSDAVIC